MKLKVGVITGTRAEYGLLYWPMKALQADSSVELQVYVTGTHLSSLHGNTVDIIQKDNFPITKKIPILLESDDPVSIAKTISAATTGFAETFAEHKPDLIVLLGDRYELLGPATAAMCASIPIAHLHGGELTEGLIDEAVRHSLTKMSHLHFVATETYRKRVIQMGEHPSSVYNVGAPGLETIKKTELISKEDFSSETGYIFAKKNFLISYHPVTLKSEDTVKDFEQILKALDKQKDSHFLFTAPNADEGGRIIAEMIQKFCSTNKERAFYVKSLGTQKYLSALKHFDVVFGNSSSGLIEAPTFKKPTINIGERQSGRIKAKSVIDCPAKMNAILTAIKKAESKKFQTQLKKVVNPYGKGEVSKKIVAIIKKKYRKKMVIKKFYDL